MRGKWGGGGGGGLETLELSVICRWGVTFRFFFLNRDVILDQNMPFFHAFIRSRGSLESHTRF